MKRTNQRIAFLCGLIISAQVLLGCGDMGISMYTITPGGSFEPASTPIPAELPNPASSAAQATIDTGQRQLLVIANQATEANLAVSGTEDASSQATLDALERQKIEFDNQATLVSLNITQAAATQEFFAQQTQTAQDATAAAQNSAATQTAQAILIVNDQIRQTEQAEATRAAFSLTATSDAQSRNATEIAQTQAFLFALVTGTAQAQQTETIFPLTATPQAVTLAALQMQQYDREQQAFEDRVVAPLKPVLAILFIFTISLGFVYAYRRIGTSLRYQIGPVPRYRQPLLIDGHIRHMNTIEGVMANTDARFRRKSALKLSPANLPGGPDPAVHVEIVDASDPPIAGWISEVERRLAGKGRNDP